MLISRNSIILLENKLQVQVILDLSQDIIEMDLSNQNLFQVLQRGDRGIQGAHEEAIILVGLTRAGKSTCFNWVLKKPMLGQGKLNSYYINITKEDEATAKLGNNYTSVTLAPNVHVDYTPEVSLIDMAGYLDTRNFVGVIGVSYFLKAIFQKVRKAKFLIVIDEHRFVQQTGEGIIKTFNGFINMFRIDLMDQEMKQKLKSSVGVVVTRSKYGEDHYDYMQEVVRRLKDEGLNAPNKGLIIELIEHLCSQARVEEFKAAVQNKNPQECNFVERFNDKLGWKYFDLNEAQKKLQESVISVPFQKDFSQLTEEQRYKFKQAIDQRVNSYTGFSQILSVLKTNFKQNWGLFLNTWSNQRKIESNHYKMKPMFDKIRQFLDTNDVYNSRELIEPIISIGYEPLGFVKAISKIIKMYEITEGLGEKALLVSQFPEVMKTFSGEFSTLIDCMGAFTLNNEEEELIQRLKFILNRGFRQFQKLYQLHPESIHNVKQELPDKLNDVFGEKKIIFLYRFVNGLNSDILPKIFPSIAELQEYEIFFNTYVQLCSSERQKISKEEEESIRLQPIFFSQIRCNLEMAKADVLVFQGDKNKALHCYIRAIRSYGDIMKSIEDSTKPEEERDVQLNMLFMKKVKLVRRIVSILKNMPQTQDFLPKVSALRLCQHHNMIDDTCQIYQLILQSSSTTPRAKLSMYDDYANFVINWGDFEEGIRLLKKKLRYQEDDFDEQKATAYKIKETITNRDTIFEDAKKRFNEWKRLPNDSELDQQLAQLEMLVPK